MSSSCVYKPVCLKLPVKRSKEILLNWTELIFKPWKWEHFCEWGNLDILTSSRGLRRCFRVKNRRFVFSECILSMRVPREKEEKSCGGFSTISALDSSREIRPPNWEQAAGVKRIWSNQSHNWMWPSMAALWAQSNHGVVEPAADSPALCSHMLQRGVTFQQMVNPWTADEKKKCCRKEKKKTPNMSLSNHSTGLYIHL